MSHDETAEAGGALPGTAILFCLVLLIAATGCGGEALPLGPYDGSVPLGDAGPPAKSCVTSDDCNGGICLAGTCCAESQVCGEICCPGDQTCFASACVTPGKICLSAGDCDEGQYCEPSLGPDPGDPVTPDDPRCVAPAPRAGRCLDLPPRCADDAPPDADCLPVCEVRPTGELKAVAKWRWGVGTAREHLDHLDVWSTPTVGRVTDSNCDGEVNELDPPNIIFVSGDVKGVQCANKNHSPTNCRLGVLRVLDGASGKEIWSLAEPEPDSALGFAGLSIAIGDLDGDGWLEIVALSGDGRVVVIDHQGEVLAISEEQVLGHDANNFGWGGALALADMDGDGKVEIAYGGTVFSYDGGKRTLEQRFAKPGNWISTFVDLDLAGDGNLELLAGLVAYRADGTELWTSPVDANHGASYTAVGDFDKDGKPEVALVNKGRLWLLEGATGAVRAGPFTLPGTGNGGPPTVADFDGDGLPEIGVAMATFYSVVKPDAAAQTLSLLWQTANHDFSSSVTGSTVFDFDGDGSAEVIYNDECFLWVYDGKTGAVRFAAPTTSFTATEASLVADVDGDGRAEIVMIANGVNPEADGWKCNIEPWNQPDPANNRPAWEAPEGQPFHRGITVWGDELERWVGTRTLWNQHTYHVTNICDSRDSACSGADNRYGAIPRREARNWTLPWLNSFRQNVQDKGLFDAADATVTLRVSCSSPIELVATLRNIGLAPLPAGIAVGFFRRGSTGDDELLDEQQSPTALFPGQAVNLTFVGKPGDGLDPAGTYLAKIITGAGARSFTECRTDNNESPPVSSPCLVK